MHEMCQQTARKQLVLSCFLMQIPNHKPQHSLISFWIGVFVTKMVNSLGSGSVSHTKEEPSFEGRAFILFKHVLKLSTSTQHQGLLLLE